MYTADTLMEMKKADPGGELFLVVGWDVADTLRPGTLRGGAGPGNAGGRQPARVLRPRHLEAQGWRVEDVIVPNLEISSTDLRARAADGRPLDYLIPEAGVRCIRSRGCSCRGMTSTDRRERLLASAPPRVVAVTAGSGSAGSGPANPEVGSGPGRGSAGSVGGGASCGRSSPRWACSSWPWL